MLLAAMLPSSLPAQTTEANIRARLVNKPLYLRGLWGADKLEFDAAGRLIGSSAPVSFTLAGVDVTAVEVTADGLQVEGQRVGLVFDKDKVHRLGLKTPKIAGSGAEKLTVHIARPADGDYTGAIDSVFTGDLADLVDGMPFCWQKYAQKHFVPAGSGMALAPPAAGSDAKAVDPAKLPEVISRVIAPRLIRQADPEYSQAARALNFSGVSLVDLIVDASGMPARIQVLHPVGLGLDEAAVAAVSKYVFKPAMEGDHPVPVELNIEVNFQRF